MKAQKGDTITINSRKVGGRRRVGTIVSVGKQGGPPYGVKWQGSDSEHFVFPGSDAEVKPRRKT